MTADCNTKVHFFNFFSIFFAQILKIELLSKFSSGGFKPYINMIDMVMQANILLFR